MGVGERLFAAQRWLSVRKPQMALRFDTLSWTSTETILGRREG